MPASSSGADEEADLQIAGERRLQLAPGVVAFLHFGYRRAHGRANAVAIDCVGCERAAVWAGVHPREGAGIGLSHRGRVRVCRCDHRRVAGLGRPQRGRAHAGKISALVELHAGAGRARLRFGAASAAIARLAAVLGRFDRAEIGRRRWVGLRHLGHHPRGHAEQCCRRQQPEPLSLHRVGLCDSKRVREVSARAAARG